jgi:hypothetical protein
VAGFSFTQQKLQQWIPNYYYYYYYMDDEEESLIKKEIIDIKDQPKDAGCSFFSDII